MVEVDFAISMRAIIWPILEMQTSFARNSYNVIFLIVNRGGNSDLAKMGPELRMLGLIVLSVLEWAPLVSGGKKVNQNEITIKMHDIRLSCGYTQERARALFSERYIHLRKRLPDFGISFPSPSNKWNEKLICIQRNCKFPELLDLLMGKSVRAQQASAQSRVSTDSRPMVAIAAIPASAPDSVNQTQHAQLHNTTPNIEAVQPVGAECAGNEGERLGRQVQGVGPVPVGAEVAVAPPSQQFPIVDIISKAGRNGERHIRVTSRNGKCAHWFKVPKAVKAVKSYNTFQKLLPTKTIKRMLRTVAGDSKVGVKIRALHKSLDAFIEHCTKRDKTYGIRGLDILFPAVAFDRILPPVLHYLLGIGKKILDHIDMYIKDKLERLHEQDGALPVTAAFYNMRDRKYKIVRHKYFTQQLVGNDIHRLLLNHAAVCNDAAIIMKDVALRRAGCTESDADIDAFLGKIKNLLIFESIHMLMSKTQPLSNDELTIYDHLTSRFGTYGRNISLL